MFMISMMLWGVTYHQVKAGNPDRPSGAQDPGLGGAAVSMWRSCSGWRPWAFLLTFPLFLGQLGKEGRGEKDKRVVKGDIFYPLIDMGH